MRARAHFFIEWELGRADDYPEEVVSWVQAAESDLSEMYLNGDLLNFEIGSNDCIDVESVRGDWEPVDMDYVPPFERSGDGPDATFPEWPYIPPPSPFYSDRDLEDERTDAEETKAELFQALKDSIALGFE